mgnify:CR=1 FL=1
MSESRTEPQSGYDILQITLRGLEAGLHVRLIASFDLKCCDATDSVTDVLNRDEFSDFDYIPVRDAGRIVGVLERNNLRGTGTALNAMRQLDDSLLIAADEPLGNFLRLARDNSYRLVVSGSRIDGIVTRSDLHKLPVRLYVFTLVGHLDSLMTALIRTEFPDDGWLNLLESDRQRKLRGLWKTYRNERLNPALLELALFSDKRTIVTALLGLTEEQQAELKAINDLRNDIAHDRKYAEDAEALQHFIRTVELTEHWIDHLTERLQPLSERATNRDLAASPNTQ